MNLMMEPVPGAVATGSHPETWSGALDWDPAATALGTDLMAKHKIWR